MGLGRSAPPRQALSASPPSDARRRQPSARRARRGRVRQAAPRRPRHLPAVLPAAPRGEPRRPEVVRARHPPASPVARRRCGASRRGAARWSSTPDPSTPLLAATSPAWCRSRSGRSSPPGSAGSLRPTQRSCSSSRLIKTAVEIVRQARNVGYESILGELDGGITVWIGAGQ